MRFLPNTLASLLLILPILWIQVSSQYLVPDPLVQFFKDGGFEISIPADEDVTQVGFHAKKNGDLDGITAGTWNEEVTQPKAGRFVFHVQNVTFDADDRLRFWYRVVHKGTNYYKLQQVALAGGKES